MRKDMKKQLKMGVIALLALVGLVLIASEPTDESRWFAVMFWKSLAGFGCWGVCALLYRYWDSRGELPECEDDVEL